MNYLLRINPEYSHTKENVMIGKFPDCHHIQKCISEYHPSIPTSLESLMDESELTLDLENMVLELDNTQECCEAIRKICLQTRKQGKTEATLHKKKTYFIHHLCKYLSSHFKEYIYSGLYPELENYWLNRYFSEYDQKLLTEPIPLYHISNSITSWVQDLESLTEHNQGIDFDMLHKLSNLSYLSFDRDGYHLSPYVRATFVWDIRVSQYEYLCRRYYQSWGKKFTDEYVRLREALHGITIEVPMPKRPCYAYPTFPVVCVWPKKTWKYSQLIEASVIVNTLVAPIVREYK